MADRDLAASPGVTTPLPIAPRAMTTCAPHATNAPQQFVFFSSEKDAHASSYTAQRGAHRHAILDTAAVEQTRL